MNSPCSSQISTCGSTSIPSTTCRIRSSVSQGDSARPSAHPSAASKARLPRRCGVHTAFSSCRVTSPACTALSIRTTRSMNESHRAQASTTSAGAAHRSPATTSWGIGSGCRLVRMPARKGRGSSNCIATRTGVSAGNGGNAHPRIRAAVSAVKHPCLVSRSCQPAKSARHSSSDSPPSSRRRWTPLVTGWKHTLLGQPRTAFTARSVIPPASARPPTSVAGVSPRLWMRDSRPNLGTR